MAAVPVDEPAACGGDPSSASCDEGQNGGVAARVRVRVLGSPTICGVPDDFHLRPQALEFLTYLIVRGGLAWQHEVIEDLMPEAPYRKAAQRLHTWTYNLREAFKRVAGDGIRLRLRKHRYSLVTKAFDVDLWWMRGAITAAGVTADPVARTAALRRAVAAYTAPFADGSDGYLWMAAYREAVRKEYVTAVVSLAELADYRDAAAVLDVARRIHPDDADLAAAEASLQQRSA
jgi:two-component SAPR family response regulator